MADSESGYSIRRHYVDQFFMKSMEGIKAGSFILDLGGNKIRKRGMFDVESYHVKLVYANQSPANIPDVICDAALLPFASSAFDAVICAEVLEHVVAPHAILEEVYRVLKPGGTLLATVPFMFPVHPDPSDYLRYTDEYLSLLLRKVGYETLTVERQGGFWCMWAELLRALVHELRQREDLRGRVANLAGFDLLLKWIKKRAVQLDDSVPQWKSVYCSGTTTGFGIKATKNTRHYTRNSKSRSIIGELKW